MICPTFGVRPPPREEREGGSAWRGVWVFCRECFGKPYYLLYFATWSFSWVAFMPVIIFNLYFAKSVGMSMDAYGKCLALTYLISLILAYPIGILVDRLHPLRMSLIMQGIYFVVTLLGGLFATNLTIFAVAFIAHGVVSGAWMTSTASLGQRLFPRDRFAQYTSATGMVSSLGVMVAGPVTGYFLDVTGHVYRHTYLLAAVCTALAWITGYLLYRRFLRLGGPDHYQAP